MEASERPYVAIIRKRGRKPSANPKPAKSGSRPTYSIVANLVERQFDEEFSKRYMTTKAAVWHSGHALVRLLVAGENDINVLRRALPISRNPDDWVNTAPIQPIGAFRVKKKPETPKE